jgi:hypothetical protein
MTRYQNGAQKLCCREEDESGLSKKELVILSPHWGYLNAMYGFSKGPKKEKKKKKKPRADR